MPLIASATGKATQLCVGACSLRSLGKLHNSVYAPFNGSTFDTILCMHHLMDPLLTLFSVDT